jgi:osmotically-inducible protein OsmY
MRRFWIALLMAAVITAVAPVAAQSKEDDRMVDEVRLKLAGDVSVNGGAIEVDVRGGVVSLKGRVKNEKARTKAERLAKKVKGVKSVDNQLKVDPNAH